MTSTELIEKFQCPGCVCGSNTKCGSFKAGTSGGVSCKSHVLGTILFPGGNVALGLSKGFCKPGIDWSQELPRSFNKMNIRLWEKGTSPEWDNFNIPVWAMEEEGFLFVRTYCPRVNNSFVDVIEGGSLSMTPSAINAGAFYDDFD